MQSIKPKVYFQNIILDTSEEVLSNKTKKLGGGGGGNRTRIQRLRSRESTRLVNSLLSHLFQASKLTRTWSKPAWLTIRAAFADGERSASLNWVMPRSVASSWLPARHLWLELTRQQEPILGWHLFFAWCFNELTSKPDVHPKINTSPCRSLSPPI